MASTPKTMTTVLHVLRRSLPNKPLKLNGRALGRRSQRQVLFGGMSTGQVSSSPIGSARSFARRNGSSACLGSVRRGSPDAGIASATWPAAYSTTKPGRLRYHPATVPVKIRSTFPTNISARCAKYNLEGSRRRVPAVTPLPFQERVQPLGNGIKACVPIELEVEDINSICLA
jgi:hypothetical protein